MGKTNTSDALEKASKIFESRGIEGYEGAINDIKDDATQLYATLDDIKCRPGSEAGRLIALAKTHLETSVMFAVKACSRMKEGVTV